MAQNVKIGLLGIFIFFVWSTISWLAFPWHMPTFRSFKTNLEQVQLVANHANHVE